MQTAQFKTAPGFRFVNGKLMISREEEVMLVGTWPELEAVRKVAQGRRWNAFVPCFRLLRPRSKGAEARSAGDIGPAGVRSRALDPLWEKELAFLNFRHSIPTDFATAVEGFTNRQWGLLRLCCKREQTQDQLLQNPALGFAVAHIQHFRGPIENPLGRAAQVVLEKQRQVAGRLRFPGSQAWANILGKIPARAVSLSRLLSLQKHCVNPDLEKSLCHLKTIHGGVLDLIEDKQVFDQASPVLLDEIASTREERDEAETVHLLRDILELHKVMGTIDQLRPLRSIPQVRRKHQEALEARTQQIVRAQKEALLPEPLLPGTKNIMPMSTMQQLWEEGQQQHNCVGTYGDDVRNGHCYGYRVLSPERATLAIEKGPDGCWQIQQLKLACNAAVDAETWKAVEDWLRQFSMSV